ncbi:Mannose-1-phosphate guanylyltransferase, Phosphoglucosamine mutase [[Leptolyngbya] sp. PCC 7376]|uniref:mannose-1-phosphate guanyltransferase n=1 Tax=[Leptolyngbya] sp. PCC 7376 TaxID=111781 RepID=UPI00029F4754|nr:mannose-1-phosphate guanyltransferase [[Leptolyngbya] sp. PCC 7376]AFY36760.1 Mannose-1-phosphate guanylyltransferase, Phosphoglucosamine mutase [[Leptolyngbya] sp. PCC 7376]
MRAILMAGGAGTRLRPLTCNIPKPMVPVLNRPIAEHIINLLKRHSITEVIATLHYEPDVMRDYFQDGSEFGVEMHYAIEEEQPLGTAGCVKNVQELLTDTFLVISGDSVTDFDLTAAIAFHREKQSKATLILTRVPNPVEFGVVITDDNHQICRFLEKPSTSEIFSDTVNTGTYILEPDVLQYLPDNKECDFSKDLFPLLLQNSEPMYGYVAEDCYWCDVGHLEAYRTAQYDALERKVEVEYAYTERSPGIWVGQNTFIDDTAKIQPPVMIGDNCRIGARVHLESGTVIGDNVTVGSHADLKRPILWNGVMLGEEVHLSACTIVRGSRVDRRAHVLEGAVIGALSTVEEEAHIGTGVRIWPNKRVEAGAILNINLIWGNTAHRNLFGQRGVAGLANIDITPEFAVKLGAAYGSTLRVGATVIVSRDQRSVSRMVSRSLIAGLMSAGINIQNLQATAIPIARTMATIFDVEGGIHVRLHPERRDHILIEFIDAQGINISKEKEKKIEGTYFKEDLRRVSITEIGDMAMPAQVVDIYSQRFEQYLNVGALTNSGSKVVIDYAYAVANAVLPRLLSKFRCDAIVLNASLKQTSLLGQEKDLLLLQLGHVVEALRASMGVQVAGNGEQLTLVDETGLAIIGESLTALMTSILLTSNPRSTVVVPVYASSAVEQIARRHDAKVVRTKANPTALMEACRNNINVVMGGSGDMGFIFPELHPGFDAMFTIAKLIEMLTIQERSLGQIRVELPTVYHKSFTLRCPWRIKGSLMRHLVETHDDVNLELIDGVKIVDPVSDNWALILPDAGEPLVHIFVNSNSREWSEKTIWRYRQQVQAFITHEQSGRQLTV